MKTAWAFWDFGSAAFNAVLVTFIFSVYLTDSVGSQIDAGQTPSFYYSIALAVAGAAIALVVPVMGQHADAHGTRRRSLVVWTLVTIALMACLFLVRNDAPVWFWVGITVMAVASVIFEFAEVNYFAMLNQIATRATVGRTRASAGRSATSAGSWCCCCASCSLSPGRAGSSACPPTAG